MNASDVGDVRVVDVLERRSGGVQPRRGVPRSHFRHGPAPPGPASRRRPAASDQRTSPEKATAGRADLLRVVHAGRLDEADRGGDQAVKPTATYWIVFRPARTPVAQPWAERLRLCSRRRPRAGRRERHRVAVTVVQPMSRTRLARTTCSIVPENIDLARTDGGAAKRQRLDRRVDPRKRPGVLESSREVIAVLGRAAASTQRAWSRMYDPTRSSGCVKLRSSCHGSRPGSSECGRGRLPPRAATRKCRWPSSPPRPP